MLALARRGSDNKCSSRCFGGGRRRRLSLHKLIRVCVCVCLNILKYVLSCCTTCSPYAACVLFVGVSVCSCVCVRLFASFDGTEKQARVGGWGGGGQRSAHTAWISRYAWSSVRPTARALPGRPAEIYAFITHKPVAPAHPHEVHTQCAACSLFDAFVRCVSAAGVCCVYLYCTHVHADWVTGGGGVAGDLVSVAAGLLRSCIRLGSDGETGPGRGGD